VPSGTEASEISDESDESGGGEKADTGDGEVSLNQGYLLCEGSELTLTGVNSAFELSDLRAGFGKEGAKGIRETRLGVFEGGPDVGYDVVSSERNEDALLTKKPADGVDASCPILEPGRAEAMKRAEELLGGRLDGDGSNLVVAVGLEDATRVCAVGLVAEDVGSDVLRREKNGTVAELFDLPRVEMGGSAGFHDHGSLWNLGHELEELLPWDSTGLLNAARLVRDRNLQAILCQIDAYKSIVLHGGLLLIATQHDCGTSMPIQSQGGVHLIRCT
jgi:hypothetical protein